MSLRRLSRNALLSSATIAASALLLFELYRFLAREIGIEQIGVWSLVLASAGIVRLAELGMTGSVVKFVAGDLGANRLAAAGSTVLMGLTVAVTGVALACALLYPVVHWLLEQTVSDANLLTIAQGLVPWVILSCLFMSVVTILGGAIDGLQRTDIRSVAMVTGSAVQLALAYWLVPVHGLAALGPIQLIFVIVQAALLLSGLVLLARRQRWGWPTWQSQRLGQLLRYGGGFQLTALGQLFFEPSVRWLLGIFGGLTVTGYYELATRAVVQLRQVLVAGYQMLVPYLAARFGSQARDVAQTRQYYERLAQVMQLTALPYFVLIGAALPFMLTWWAGRYADLFVAIGLLCLTGWFVSTLAVPAFMLYLSIGHLRWIALNQLLIGALNLVFGTLGGFWFGGLGVVFGAMMALALGSLVVVVQFHREYQVSFRGSLSPVIGWMAVVGLIGVAAMTSYALYWAGQGLPHLGALVGYGTLAAVLIAIMWQDPMRRALVERVQPLASKTGKL